MCPLRVVVCAFIALAAPICLVTRFRLYLHYFVAFSQDLNVAGTIVHDSQMRNALCLIIQLVLTVQHIFRPCERFISMATS